MFYFKKEIILRTYFIQDIGVYLAVKNNNENYQSTVIREIKEEINYKIDKKFKIFYKT